MKNKTKKIIKWILIIGGIALVIYLISQSGDSNLFSVASGTHTVPPMGGGR